VNQIYAQINKTPIKL